MPKCTQSLNMNNLCNINNNSGEFYIQIIPALIYAGIQTVYKPHFLFEIKKPQMQGTTLRGAGYTCRAVRDLAGRNPAAPSALGREGEPPPKHKIPHTFRMGNFVHQEIFIVLSLFCISEISISRITHNLIQICQVAV